MSSLHPDDQLRAAAEFSPTAATSSLRIFGGAPSRSCVAISARLLTHDDTDVGAATLARDGHGVLLIAEWSTSTPSRS